MLRKIVVTPQTYIYLAFLLLIVPFRWLFSWLTAVCIHELFHWITVRICGGDIERLRIEISGACMESSTLSDGKQLFSVLAGPLGGCLPVLLGQWFPRLALCCLALSIYNLLPLLPLDGGRALQILVRNNITFRRSQIFILILLWGCALWGTFYLRLGLLPILVMCLLLMKNRKIPCNGEVCAVQ